MKLENYQALAVRTAKIFTELKDNLIHAAMGISSEAGELAETIVSAWMQLPFHVDNIHEELGDACWYAAYLCHVMGWKFEDMLLEPGDASEMSVTLAAAVIGRNPVALTLVLNQHGGNVTSVVKAHAIYGKELDVDLLKRELALYVTTASLLSDIHDIPFEGVTLAGNIAKLQKRYPDKYSDTAAIERADKAAVLRLVQ